MRRRVLLVLTLSGALLVAGCATSKTNTAAPSGTTASPTASAGTADCPTRNTKAFAKTRFVADLGGSLFLVRRYLVQPYQAGKFTKGANGRTIA